MGTSGNAFERLEEVTASALSLPALMCCKVVASELSMLSGLGREDRNPVQEARYRQLQAWHQRIYKRAEEQIRDAADNHLTEGQVKAIRAALERDSRQFERK